MKRDSLRDHLSESMKHFWSSLLILISFILADKEICHEGTELQLKIFYFLIIFPSSVDKNGAN